MPAGPARDSYHPPRPHRARRTLGTAVALSTAVAGVVAMAPPASARLASGTLSIGDVTVQEGDTGGTQKARFTVTLDGTNPLGDLTVTYETKGGSALSGEDYTGRAGSVTFGATERQKVIDIPIVGDDWAEDDESFTVVLLQVTSDDSMVSIDDDTGVATVTNDDLNPTVDVGDAVVTEGDVGFRLVSVPLTLSGPSQNPVSVLVDTADDSAVAGTDYSSISARITFAADATSGSLDVAVQGDRVFEDDQTFTVTLSDPEGFLDLGDDTSTVTIVDNEVVPTVSIGGGVSVIEGNTGTRGLRFPLTLSGPSEAPVSVHVRTDSGTATRGSDYTPLTYRHTFAPLTTTATVEVPVHGDTVVEPDETVGVAIAEPLGPVVVGTSSASGTILDDDDARSADARWVGRLLVDFLDLDPELYPDVIDEARYLLDNGWTHFDVAQAIAYNDAYLGELVEQLYRSTLGRGSDPDGLAYWIGQYRAGVNPAYIASLFYASDEYHRRAGGTDRAWIEDLYDQLLFRTAEDAGVDYWVGELRRGVGRDTVATAFYGSLESRRTRVTRLYDRFLGRGPDSAGLDYWAEQLTDGRDVDLAVLLAASNEYYARAQR